MGCADAVASCVASTNHEDILAFGCDALVLRELHACKDTVLLGKQLKSKMNALQLTARNIEVAGSGSAGSDYD